MHSVLGALRRFVRIFLIYNDFQRQLICFFGISVYGKDIMTVIEQPFDIQDMLNVAPQGKRTVVYEARYLKALFLNL